MENIAGTLTAEDVEFLTNLANELRTQDRRATAKPVIFQVFERERVWCIDPRYADDLGLLISDDAVECLTLEDAKEQLADYDEIPTETLDGLASLEDIEAFCDRRGIRCTLTGYQEREVLSNAFLTLSGYEEHMALNGHNYRHGASSYVTHATRNPQLARLLEIVEKFATVEEARR